ncbi:MAG: glycosyltransferase family 2 protein [Oscillospiraceae bacterium]|nr:glycosyltransferase family 2 protein [Oscillospiraceae bacterium]
MKLISIVVPCYNEEEVLPLFYEEIQKIMNQMKEEHSELAFELVFIDDGSRDKTLTLLREMALKDERVRYISFSRNFGKEAGMFAGLENAKGDYVVVMDADLQHPPAFLPKMYNFVKDGEYDCATTRRVSRKGESKIRSAFARLFYKIMNKISQTEIVDGAQDFRFMSRQMVNAILDMQEYNRFSKGIFSWVGFKTKYIEYENVERAAGATSWSFWGLFRYSLEGIIAFSTAPLMIACILGIIACLAGLVLLILWIVQAVHGDASRAQTGLMCALFLLGGLQMLCTGISAQYLAKAYMESKHRPIYLMRENEEIYRARHQAEAQES